MEDKSVNRVIDNTDFSNEYVENGLLIQEVDVQHLEQGLLRTAALIDEHHDFVVLLKNYETMLATMHKLDYHKLSDLLGIQIGLYEDKQTILTHRKQFRHIHVSYSAEQTSLLHGASAQFFQAIIIMDYLAIPIRTPL